ncbi:hypothetical protein QAD02_019845 [Eretmocerus hayati]|uniref:Uncharacterized protein n=1 Tax=Eretmocerus hayati TaxID=131215 RepID=A0ACC2PKS2_9HYME|nr:hypothetical protein QAD02_019845 [Eretmocerus hayati]
MLESEDLPRMRPLSPNTACRLPEPKRIRNDKVSLRVANVNKAPKPQNFKPCTGSRVNSVCTMMLKDVGAMLRKFATDAQEQSDAYRARAWPISANFLTSRSSEALPVYMNTTQVCETKSSDKK